MVIDVTHSTAYLGLSQYNAQFIIANIFPLCYNDNVLTIFFKLPDSAQWMCQKLVGRIDNNDIMT